MNKFAVGDRIGRRNHVTGTWGYGAVVGFLSNEHGQIWPTMVLRVHLDGTLHPVLLWITDLRPEEEARALDAEQRLTRG